jgi:transposase
MNYMMKKIDDVVSMYDYEGLTIMEIVEKTGVSEDEVIDVLNEFSETFT